MLRAEGLQVNRGADVIFKDLSFVVHAGQTIGVAGRNGVGKSTLFALLEGRIQADAGDLDMPSDWTIASMAQEVDATQRPALDYVLDGHTRLRDLERQLEQNPDDASLHSQYADEGGYEAQARAAEILAGLGFSNADQQRPYADFSGGWRIRLNLARTLMQPADLLLLDEPTNHLDMETIIWLERWLRRFPGTVLMIAHDRAFLDATTQHTLYLSKGQGELYSGNYTACERQRAERAEQAAALATKQAAQAAHMQQFIDRFRAKASKAKQVQSRIKALERMQSIAIVQAESPYHVTFQDPAKASNPLFSLRNVNLGYSAEVPVLEGIRQSILPGDRIGVLGANGAGKSTLLKALVGDLEPLSGDLQRGAHSPVGYFAQHQLETLDTSTDAATTLARARPNWTAQQCLDFLGSWGFSADMTRRPIDTLSGGEKARLVLSIIALDQPAILVMDEPTNHLDLDMRDALALALQDYLGAVIIVSHDRAMLDKTVDQLWWVHQGQVSVFDGDLADYTSLSPDTSTPDSPKPTYTRRDERRDRAAQRESERSLRKEIKQLEQKMNRQAEQLAALEGQLADSDTYQSLPPTELDALLSEAGKLRGLLEQTEEAWLEATTRLEAQQSDA